MKSILICVDLCFSVAKFLTGHENGLDQGIPSELVRFMVRS